MVRALELARELGADRVDLLLDSKLIVEQLHGRWRVKDAKLQPLWAEAMRCSAGPTLVGDARPAGARTRRPTRSRTRRSTASMAGGRAVRGAAPAAAGGDAARPVP